MEINSRSTGICCTLQYPLPSLWILGVQSECFMHLIQAPIVGQKKPGSPLQQGG